jgi:hypothetical protein
MRASDSAVVLEDRQRKVEVVATVYGRVRAHGPGGSRRLQGIGVHRLLAEARRTGHLPPVPLAQAAADEGAHGARPGVEGGESAASKYPGIGSLFDFAPR